MLRTEWAPLPPAGRSSGEPVNDDATLIEASLDDAELFTQIYDRHAAVLYRFAARRLGPELAEDAVSETMLTAFRIRNRYDSEHRDARPWLLGVLTREISSHRRAERNRYRTLSRTAHDREAQDSQTTRGAPRPDRTDPHRRRVCRGARRGGGGCPAYHERR
jgi:RNA polymerase sigma-70 factor (ECF subfamily)